MIYSFVPQLLFGLVQCLYDSFNDYKYEASCAKYFSPKLQLISLDFMSDYVALVFVV